MAGRLPVNVSYQLPAGWVSVPPDEVKAHSSAFFAFHKFSVEDHFGANITLEGGVWPNPAPLGEIADRTVHNLREKVTYPQVEVLERRMINQPAIPEFSSPAVQALRQVLKIRRYMDFAELWLIQIQTYQPVPYPRDPRKQAVIAILMTATPTQLDKVSGDFEFFLYSVLQRTLGVKYFGSLEEVDGTKVAATANAAADAVRDIAATADEWATVGWEPLAEGDGSR